MCVPQRMKTVTPVLSVNAQEVTLAADCACSAEHMVHQASRHAMADGNGFFADQFDNLSNYRAHLQTGREILEQTSGKLDAFVCGAGTGGTLAGVSYEIKKRCQKIRTYLVDPPGSSLLLKVFLTC
jgi:cysteine synthase A